MKINRSKLQLYVLKFDIYNVWIVYICIIHTGRSKPVTTVEYSNTDVSIKNQIHI